MPYIILAHDKPDQDLLREELRESHRNHLKSIGPKLIASGAILSDSGQVIGGMSIIDTEDIEEARRFASEDPYSKHEIRVTISIIKWRKRWWEGKFLL